MIGPLRTLISAIQSFATHSHSSTNYEQATVCPCQVVVHFPRESIDSVGYIKSSNDLDRFSLRKMSSKRLQGYSCFQGSTRAHVQQGANLLFPLQGNDPYHLGWVPTQKAGYQSTRRLVLCRDVVTCHVYYIYIYTYIQSPFRLKARFVETISRLP